MEMYEFLGTNAGILRISVGCSIPVILDRLTGRTMDCYVEFMSIAYVRNFVDALSRPD